MKRILQALAAALAVGTPQAASAFDGGLTLDRYPTVARGGADTAVSAVGRAHGRHEGAYRSGRYGGHDGRSYRSDHNDGYYQRSYRGDHHGGRYRNAGSFHHADDIAARRIEPRWNEGRRYRSNGSFVDVRAYGGAVDPGSFYGTSGAVGSSFITVGLPSDDWRLPSFYYGGLSGGPKILNVEEDRLDRQPYGKDGLAVSHVGAAKIIRIGPDFRAGRDRNTAAEHDDNMPTPFAELSPEERAVTVFPDPDVVERPVDPPATRRADARTAATTSEPENEPAAGATFEPWTAEWLRDCVARHPNFDSSLGTYTNEAGQRRFCTGEP
ncbi:hypothetical protein ACLNGM_10780 [Aureimonas phyllosphaerae]|uniref:hypothetical protein n=1 Tax=Aureimonas phyllosphaerae TaxID=1166078 RepID=UPI003A5BD067